MVGSVKNPIGILSCWLTAGECQRRFVARQFVIVCHERTFQKVVAKPTAEKPAIVEKEKCREPIEPSVTFVIPECACRSGLPP
jgi:hypothetical protein